MRKKFYFFVFAFLVGTGLMHAQSSQQVIGAFPSMDGGFEGQLTTGYLTSTSIATNTQRTDWTTNSANLGRVFTTSDSGGMAVRTGGKGLWAYTNGTTKRWQSPTTVVNGAVGGPGAITNATQYTQQYYYRTTGAVQDTQMQVGINPDGTTFSLNYPTTFKLSGTSGVWTKVAVSYTTGNATNNPRYGIGIIRHNTGTMDVPLWIDDFCIYPGTTDVTAPDPITSPYTHSLGATQMTIKWNTPSTGYDQGGYMVVRGTGTYPVGTPNINGIYSVGGTITSGETVVYLGTDTTFNNTGLSPNTRYYYRIFTVDKAFNYASGVDYSDSTTSPSFATEPTVQVSGLSFSNITQNSVKISWTNGDGTNRLLVMRASTAVTSSPSDGASYTANSTFGSGTPIATNEYVVFNGTYDTVTVTGLSKASKYYVKAFEFNGSGGTENYYLSGAPGGGFFTLPGVVTSNGTGGGPYATGSSWSGGVAPGTQDSVVIQSTDIVTVTASGVNCYSMNVQAGGKIYANVTLPTSGIIYVNVYGPTLNVDGTWGDVADALSINFFNDLTIKGTGNIRPARIRPGSSVVGVSCTFAADSVTMVYTGSTGTGGAAIYADVSSNDNITFNVSAGKKLIFTNLGNFYPTSSNTTNSNCNTTINIYGTCDLSGANSNMHLQAASGKTCSLYVANTGTLTVGGNFYTMLSNSSTPVITVNGTMNVGKIADFTYTNAYASGTGTFNLLSGGTLKVGHAGGMNTTNGPIRTTTRSFSTSASYSFIGTGAQVTGADCPLTVQNFTCNNSAGVTLTNSITVNGVYYDGAGSLSVGANTFAYGPYAGIRYSDATLQTTSDIEFPAVNGPKSLYIDNAAGVVLHDFRTIDDTLQFIQGKLFLGDNSLTLWENGVVLSSGTANTGYVQTGTGRMVKRFAAPGSVIFQIADTTGTAVAVPVTVTFNSGTFAPGELFVTTTKAKHTNNNSTNNYLGRYWTLVPNNISAFSADVSARYAAAEVTGNDTLMYFGKWNGTKWTLGQASYAGGDSMKITGVTSFSDFTGGASDYMGGAAFVNFTAVPEGYYDEGTNKLAMKDTFKVYLANTSSPYAFVDSSNVIIDSLTFTGQATFRNAADGSYYHVIGGRALVETWSAAGQATEKGAAASSYDFTTAATQAYGSNMSQKGTKWCIYMGDVNQDQFVDFSDLGLVDNDSYNYVEGYVVTDINGDHFVDFTDLGMCDNNSYNYIGTAKPSVKKLVRPVHHRVIEKKAE